MTGFTTSVALLLLANANIVIADGTTTEIIWSTFIYSVYGDRTPYVVSDANTLTPLGARQSYNTGDFYRQRYISGNSSSDLHINGISVFEIDNGDLSILSTTDQYIQGSAQAFLQGLYPPTTSSSETYTTSAASLANGSQVDFPLNGYQYADIYTASVYDYNSISLNGNGNCPMYTASCNEYYSTQAFADLENEAQEFYLSIMSLLDPAFDSGAIGYADAFFIWDFLQYEYTHNATANSMLTDSDIEQAKYFADQLVFQMHGNLTATASSGVQDRIRAIAGRTLSTLILESFAITIEAGGDLNKMSLVFGSPEPLVAMFALSGLSDFNTDFRGFPELASSMVLELYSYGTDNSTTFPDSSDDFYVRFLFRNGSDAEIYSYPFFGGSPSQIDMPYGEFVAGMEEFAMSSVYSWCNLCASYATFCAAYDDSSSSSSGSSGSSTSKNGSPGLKPAVAGVIGALIALIIAALLFAAAMLIGGLRIHRRSSTESSNKSTLRGFKGGERMRSDQDLTLKGAGKVAGASVVTVEGADGAPQAHGHERVGSWEMKAKAKEEGEAGRSSFDADVDDAGDSGLSPFAKPVKGNDWV